MKFQSTISNFSAKNGIIVEVVFYEASGVIPFFLSICPCAELSGAVTDPCVYISITGGLEGGLYALGDLWKKSLPFTPEHLLETTSDVRPEGGLEQGAFSQTSPRDMRRGGDWRARPR